MILKFLLIGLFFFGSVCLYGANKNQSDKDIIQQYDSVTVKKLLKKGEEFNNNKKAIYFYKQAVYYAQKINNPLLLADALLTTGGYYISVVKCDSASFFIKKAIDICNTNNLRCKQVSAYIEMAALFYRKCDYPKTLEWYFSALEKNNYCKNDTVESNIYSSIADVYYRIHDYSKALEYLNKSLIINKKTGASFDILKTYNQQFYLYIPHSNQSFEKEYLAFGQPKVHHCYHQSKDSRLQW